MGAILDYSSGCGLAWTLASCAPKNIFTTETKRHRENTRKQTRGLDPYFLSQDSEVHLKTAEFKNPALSLQKPERQGRGTFDSGSFKL